MAAPATKPLSARQQLLLDLLPRFNWSFAAAGKEAGYSPTYSEHQLAKRMMADITFSGEFAKKKAELTEKTGIDAEWWLNKCRERLAVCTEGDSPRDETNAKGYIDMIGRHLGVYEQDNRQRQTQIGMVIM